MTTQRVRPGSQETLAVYTPDEAREFGIRVAAAAAAYTGHLAAEPDELGRVAHEHALRKGGWVIRSTREISDVFEDEGFDVTLADEGGGLAERERDRPSSSAGKDTYRMRLVATKR